MKIDVFPHIMPAKYKEALFNVAPAGFPFQDVIESLPTLYDLEGNARRLFRLPI